MSIKAENCAKVYASYVIATPPLAAAAAVEVGDRVKRSIPVPLIDDFVGATAGALTFAGALLASPLLPPAATAYQAVWLDGCQGGQRQLERAFTDWPGIFDEVRGSGG